MRHLHSRAISSQKTGPANFQVPRRDGVSLAFALTCILFLVQAQILSHAASSISPSGLATQVSDPIPVNGQTQFNITGGTRPLTSDGHPGQNLFHSFHDFNIPSNAIANFKNDTGLATSNILGRVTGGNPSSIFGTLQTEGFGSANLFLINPSGIVFGPTSTLQVGGSVYLSTANYIRLYDGTHSAIFYADPANDSVMTAGRNSILSSAPLVDFGFVTPAAFGFLNSAPAAISLYSNELSNSHAISLVGGNTGFSYINPDTGTRTTVPEGVTIHNGAVTVPGGQFNIISVGSPGEILNGSFQSTSNINGNSFSGMGSISFSTGTRIDVSNNMGGTIRIRGSQLIMADATLSANTNSTPSSPVAVDISLTGNFTISDTRAVPAITATTNGAGNAGEVRITSANVHAESIDPQFALFALIDTHSAGTGGAGDVSITTTGNVHVNGPAPSWHFIDTGPLAQGPGGNIKIAATGTIELHGTTLSTGTQRAELLGSDASGPPGNLSLQANTIRMSEVLLLTTATLLPTKIQQAGEITLHAHGATLKDSTISATGFFGGSITMDIDHFITENTALNAFTVSGTAVSGAAQGITFNGRTLELQKGSTWNTSTFGNNAAGDIRVIASDHVSLIGNGGSDLTGLFSNSIGEFGRQGHSGNISITTPKLTLQEGRINTSTATSGNGGNVTIDATTIDMSGEFPFGDDGILGGITNIHPSGIFTQTAGSALCTGPCGNAGNIFVTTSSLNMGPGSQINSGTTNNGSGGTIDIRSTNTISLSGTLTDGSPVGVFSRTIGTSPDAGSGGNISLTAGKSFTIKDGASVSTSTTGSGDAGNILIKSDKVSITGGATITATSTGTGNAGTVVIQGLHSPANSFLLDGPGSSILTSTTKTGAGGNILIDAKNVFIRNGVKISADTLGSTTSATGGTITIQGDQVRIEQGALVTSSTTGDAKGGSITVKAHESVSLRDGATLSADSTGLGDAGNVSIHAGQRFNMQNSSVTTSAGQSSGGNIDIQATDLIRVVNGTISTSVLGGTGNGGNISIDPNTVVLQNSQIVAQAVAGHGGNITITTPLFLADQLSLIDASSQFGLNGSVTIQSPISNLSGTIGQLASKPSPIQTLIQNRCAALADGPQSTFIVNGRQTFPTMPGGWLSSPTLMPGEMLGVRSEERARGLFSASNDRFSLRRLTPSGFLVRSFANEGPTGCRL